MLKGCISREWQSLKKHSTCQKLYYISFSMASLRVFMGSLHTCASQMSHPFKGTNGRNRRLVLMGSLKKKKKVVDSEEKKELQKLS